MSTLRRRNAIPATLMHMSANGTGLGTYGRGRRPSRRLRAFSYRYSIAGDQQTRRDSLREDRDDHGLTLKQVDAFKEVFNLFDINGGGTIDAAELDAAMKSVDVHLTYEEIKDVLQVIDEDGNGEIDFTEFLTLMTSTERYLETLRGGQRDEQKENMLFSALTKFMKKSALSSLSEIERYYNMKVRKSPHVVGHYAAGARLIGLTEKQMAKHLATLNATGDQNNDSPYAQPLCLFTTNLPSDIKRMTRTHGKIRLTVIVKTQDTEQKDKDDEGCMKKESAIDTTENLTESGTGDVDKKTTTMPVNHMHKRKLQRLQRTPLRIQSSPVPLPAVSVKGSKDPSLLTIEDLPMIRSRVQQAYETYCKKHEAMRQIVAHTAAFTDLSSIPSRTQQIQFKHVLEAYNFKPTNVPPALELHTLKLPWLHMQHMAY